MEEKVYDFYSERYKNDPYFENHKFQKVPIDTLIKDNNLNNPTVLNYRAPWEGDINKYQFDPNKDKSFVYGTKTPDGRYRIGDGRHRIRALANGGYTHVNMPILDETEVMKKLGLL